jgi:MFS family permease
MIEFPAAKRDERKQSVGKNLLDGVSYIIKNPTTRLLISIGAIPPLLVMPSFFALLPVFAKDVFHSGPEALGVMMSSMGIGGLLGALFTASLGGFDRRGLLQLTALFTMSLSLLGLGLSPSLYVALPVLAIGGFCEMVYMTTNQTILQLSVPSEMRGRITSIFMLNMGLMPLGSLVLGIAADIFGAPTAVTVSGIAVVSLTTLVALLSSRLRNLRLSELNSDGAAARTPMPASTG